MKFLWLYDLSNSGNFKRPCPEAARCHDKMRDEIWDEGWSEFMNCTYFLKSVQFSTSVVFFHNGFFFDTPSFWGRDNRRLLMDFLIHLQNLNIIKGQVPTHLICLLESSIPIFYKCWVVSEHNAIIHYVPRPPLTPGCHQFLERRDFSTFRSLRKTSENETGSRKMWVICCACHDWKTQNALE